jgi:hypothetical protein
MAQAYPRNRVLINKHNFFVMRHHGTFRSVQLWAVVPPKQRWNAVVQVEQASAACCILHIALCLVYLCEYILCILGSSEYRVMACQFEQSIAEQNCLRA